MRRLVDATGHVVAEIADDRVTARRLLPLDGSGDAAGAAVSWREIEVEVDDDAADLLDAVDARLRKGGLQAAAAASKLAHVLDLDRRGATEERKATKLTVESTGGDVILAHIREQVEQVQAQDLPVRLDAPDAVHKMRAATRRLRSALTTFKPLFAADVVRPLRDELKWLAGELGAARDAEVMRDRVRKAVEADPEVPNPARWPRMRRPSSRGPTARLMTGCWPSSTGALSRHPAGARPAGHVTAVHRSGRCACCRGPAATREMSQAVRRLVDEADATPAGAERESPARRPKAAKQARYAGGVGEPVSAWTPPPSRRRWRMQEALGEHQDSVLTRERLRELACTPRAPLRLSSTAACTLSRRRGLRRRSSTSTRRGRRGASPCTAGCARRRGVTGRAFTGRRRGPR